MDGTAFFAADIGSLSRNGTTLRFGFYFLFYEIRQRSFFRTDPNTGKDKHSQMGIKISIVMKVMGSRSIGMGIVVACKRPLIFSAFGAGTLSNCFDMRRRPQ